MVQLEQQNSISFSENNIYKLLQQLIETLHTCIGKSISEAKVIHSI